MLVSLSGVGNFFSSVIGSSSVSMTREECWQALTDAVTQGDQDRVQKYVDEIRTPVSTNEFRDLFQLAQPHNNLNIKKALTQLPGFNADEICEPKTPTLLAMAGYFGDLEFVRHLLQQGADPNKVSDVASIGADHIRILLQKAKIINSLYPREPNSSRLATNCDGECRIDVALKNYDIVEAERLLDASKERLPPTIKKRGGIASDCALWKCAVRVAKLEVLRAMLVSCSPETIKIMCHKKADHATGSSLLHAAMDLGDPLLRSYLKQWVFYSSKRDVSVHFDRKTQFSEQPESPTRQTASSLKAEIEGTTLTQRGAAWQLQRACDPKGKSNYLALTSMRSLEGILSDERDKISVALHEYPVQRHAIAVDDFGGELAKLFKSDQHFRQFPLDAKTPGERVWKIPLSIPLLMGHHVEMEGKKTEHLDGTISWALIVFDPILPTAHARISTKNFSDISNWKLESFFPGRPVETYFPDGVLTLFILHADSAQHWPNDRSGVEAGEAGRRFTSVSDRVGLTPAFVHRVLREGCEGDWCDLQPYFHELPKHHVLRFLFARAHDGLLGFRAALERKHTLTSEGFLTTVKELGKPGMALENSEKEQIKLVAARNDLHEPVLWTAFQKRDAGMMTTIIRGMGGLNISEDCKVVLGAGKYLGKHAFSSALENGHADMVKPFVAAVLALPISDNGKAILLAAENEVLRKASILIALENRHMDTVSSYRQAVQPLSRHPIIRSILQQIESGMFGSRSRSGHILGDETYRLLERKYFGEISTRLGEQVSDKMLATSGEKFSGKRTMPFNRWSLSIPDKNASASNQSSIRTSLSFVSSVQTAGQESLPYQAMLFLVKETLAKISGSGFQIGPSLYDKISNIAYDIYMTPEDTGEIELTSSQQRKFLMNLEGIVDATCSVYAQGSTNDSPATSLYGLTPKQALKKNPSQAPYENYYISPNDREQRNLVDPLDGSSARLSLSMRASHVIAMAGHLVALMQGEFSDCINHVKIFGPAFQGVGADSIVIYLQDTAPQHAENLARHLYELVPQYAWFAAVPRGMHPYRRGIGYGQFSSAATSGSFGRDRANMVARAIIRHKTRAIPPEQALRYCLARQRYSLKNPAFIDRDVAL